MTEPASPPLQGLRVLDLTNRRGEMAGRLLADLGAFVLKVEPPGGVDSRRLPPFDERPGREGDSLYWASLGRGKRSAVLDLDSEDGRRSLRALCRVADVLVESLAPGYLEGRGLGYAPLAAVNPGLVYCSITPFGADGPKATWPASELTVEAAAGRVSQQGDPDRPPIPIGYPQSAFHGGAQAAADIVVALNERERSGLGQRLDTSIQAAMTWTLMDATGYPPALGTDPPGTGDDREMMAGPPGLPAVPCKDGAVLATILPDQAQSLIVTLSGEESVRALWGGEEPSHAEIDPMVALAALEAFIATRTKQELMEWAVENRVRVAPVNTTRDVLHSPHLAGREFFRRRDGRAHGLPPARFTRTPQLVHLEAPDVGADQESIRRGWPEGARPGEQVPPVARGERDGDAFAGLRVADFSWVAAGPLTAKALADHGATVVRVESSTRIDLIRQLPPFMGGILDLEHSRWYANVNTSKLGLTLDLSAPDGRELARRLCDWADVVIESYTPGVMARLGLGYEELRRDHPELIMLSTCLMGQKGPWASYGGYGNHGAGISGFHLITGWPDRIPCGPAGPYTDVVTPRFLVAAAGAALLERRRSGRGQHIELSQVEAAVHFLEPLILDESVNGRTAEPAGLLKSSVYPGGVYATAGTQRYIAISVETTAQWKALCELLPRGALDGVTFEGAATAEEDREELSRILASWTVDRDGRELEADLIENGIPASVVQRPTDLYEDPQLLHRGFFVELEHPKTGVTPYDGFATRFSAMTRTLRRPAPLLGADNEFVLQSLLGLSQPDIDRYIEAGAVR